MTSFEAHDSGQLHNKKQTTTEGSAQLSDFTARTCVTNTCQTVAHGNTDDRLSSDPATRRATTHLSSVNTKSGVVCFKRDVIDFVLVAERWALEILKILM